MAMSRVARRVISVGATLGVLVVGGVALRGASAPEDAFNYNILDISQGGPGQAPTIRFSVTNPTTGGTPYDLANDPAWTVAGGVSRLALQIGWSTRDYTNTGSGTPPALPIQIDVLRAVTGGTATKNLDGSYTVTSPKPIPLSATGTGVVAMEGHPAGADGIARLPVKSAYKFFPITDTLIVRRRAVVDINKCKQCHQPHLTVHGNNRTDEVQVCVICHNPNNTDIPFRTAGAEVPIDFKFMVHAIHAGGFRETPLVIAGFQGSLNDFSGVRFPRELRNCLNCHIDRTFELPLRPSVLGTTIVTRSTYGPPKVIDADANNDLNITPTAAVCSACHDKAEVKRHMVRTGGASFAVTQADITSGKVRERCVDCHGPGKDEDVRHAHEIGERND